MNSYLSRLCKEKKTSVFFWVRLVQETADAIKEKWRGKQLRLGGGNGLPHGLAEVYNQTIKYSLIVLCICL